MREPPAHVTGGDTRGGPELLRMFDLEWRLDEVSQHADEHEQPHTGTESEGVALGGQRWELTRD